VVTRYSDLLTPLIELDRALLRGVDVDQVDGLAAALGGLSAARNELTLQYALVSAGDPDPAELQSSEARLRTGLADFRAALDAGQRVRYATLIAGPGNTARVQLLQSVLAEQDGGGEPEAVYGAVLTELGAARDGVRSELSTLSTQLRDSRTTAVIVNAVLLLLALAVGAVVVGLIARAMIVALRRLRTGAMEVAQRRLPEAVQQMQTNGGDIAPLVVESIGIDTREEIGEVARAFDAVHTEAVRLAAQQALLRNNVNDIFVNLSQRSQGLVKRQLALIDGLERSEQDPDHLGNLFQLDHLATRMRRNNENLLVLAGAADLRARRKRPVPARDVLRAAVSEIEQYQRVTVRRAPGIAVAGPVVNDLVHLVAELLDNATSFSPPDSEVVLRAATGAGGTLVVEIADTGVGISPPDLAALNAQLADPPVVDVAVARRMGLFVVGPPRPAPQHHRRAAPGAGGPGIHATVEVPAVYLQSGATPGADGDLDVPTQVLPVTSPRARPKPRRRPARPTRAGADRPAAAVPRRARRPPGPSGLPRRAPRRDDR
jgi:signal transduction histidine kinase